MKKLLILTIALSLWLSGCKDNKQQNIQNEEIKKSITETSSEQKDNETNQDNKLDNYLETVNEEEKSMVMELLQSFSKKYSEKIKSKVSETSANIASDQNLEYSYVIFDDAGTIDDFTEIKKQSENLESEGLLTMYMGQVKAETCDMQFSFIFNDKNELLDYRFYPIQDLNKNKLTYNSQIKKAEKVIELLEKSDFTSVKNLMSDKIEMTEENEKQFFEQVESIINASKNRISLEVVDMLSRSTVQSVKDQGVNGKLIDLTITGTYEQGVPIHYNFVFSEDNEMLGLRVIPAQQSSPEIMETNPEEIKEETK